MAVVGNVRCAQRQRRRLQAAAAAAASPRRFQPSVRPRSRSAPAASPEAHALLLVLMAWLPCALGLKADAVCTCKCCQVSYRPPAMQVMGEETMCSPVPENSVPNDEPPPDCGEECMPDPAKPAVVSSVGGTVFYSRFCLSSCIPEEEKVGAFCQDLPESVAEEAASEGGNGKDWAALGNATAVVLPPAEMSPNGGTPADGEPEQEAAEAGDEIAKEEAEAHMKAADKVKAVLAAMEKKQVEESGALVALSKGRWAMGKALEARAAAAEAKVAGTLTNATAFLRAATTDAHLATDARAKMSGSAVAAAIYARAARVSADRAKVEFQEILNAPKDAAAEAVKEAIRELENTTATWKKEADEASPTPQPVYEVANLAAAPYYAAMQRAIQRRDALEAQAHELNRQAEELQHGARTVWAQAAHFQHAGNTAVAYQLVDRAKDMMEKSQTSETQAEDAYHQAEAINVDLPSYQEAASAAAAHATALAPLRWMPPPSRVPEGLGPALEFNSAPAPAPGPAPGPGPAALLLQPSLLQRRLRVSGG